MLISSLFNSSMLNIDAGSCAACPSGTLMLISTRILCSRRFLRFDWDISIFSIMTSAIDTSAALARACLNIVCLFNVNASMLSARVKTMMMVFTGRVGTGVDRLKVCLCVTLGATVVADEAAAVVDSAAVVEAEVGTGVVDTKILVVFALVLAVAVLDEIETGVLDGTREVLVLMLVAHSDVVASAVLEVRVISFEVVLVVGDGVLDDSAGVLLLLRVGNADVVAAAVLEESPGYEVVLDAGVGVLEDFTAVLLLVAKIAEHGPPSGPEYPSLQIQLVNVALPLAEWEFVGQAVHVASAISPVPFEYLPCEQRVHGDDPFTSL